MYNPSCQISDVIMCCCLMFFQVLRVCCTYQRAGPVRGSVWEAEGRSTAKLLKKVDPCGRSDACDRSLWCGGPGCFRGFLRQPR